jgi:hypothetical protein
MLATYNMFGNDDLDTNGPMSEEEMKAYGSDAQENDIWKDETCMKLLNEGVLSKSTNATKAKWTKERIINYYLHNQRLYFKDICVPKREEKKTLIAQMHENLGHFGKQRTSWTFQTFFLKFTSVITSIT